MSVRNVAVIGASADRGKFSNKAVRAYQAHGWRVFPVNPKGGEIEGFRVCTSVAELAEIDGKIHRVTMYLPPSLGEKVLPEVAALQPEEFFVNPGAESESLIETAKSLGLDPILACSIIEIGARPAAYSD